MLERRHHVEGKRTEGQAHAGHSHSNREPGIFLDDGRVDLETNQEEEETETDVGHKGQEGARVLREDVLCEARYAAEGSWSYDLG